MHRTASWLRVILRERGDAETVLLGAGLASTIRLFASAIGYVSMIVLARWIGPSGYGSYSFAIACMTMLAYPASLGLPGAELRFVSQYAAANDWQRVIGLIKAGSWLAFGCGSLIATLAIVAVLYFKSDLNAGHVAPTLVGLAGIPILALAIVRSEAIRGLGWLALAWAPLQLGQPLLLLIFITAIAFIGLDAAMAVGASVFAYIVILFVQTEVLNARLGTRAKVEPKLNLGLWLGVALSFMWIYVANAVLVQAGVIVVGIFLTPQDTAIYGAAAATSRLVTFPLYATTALGMPKFAVLHAQERQLELQALVTNLIRWTFWPSLAIALILIVFGSTVLNLFGPGFEQGYAILLILMFGQLVNAFAGPAGSLLSMTGHQIVTAQVLCTSAVFGVVVALVFTQFWGSVGTALAFSGAIAALNAWLAKIVMHKVGISLSLSRSFKGLIGR